MALVKAGKCLIECFLAAEFHFLQLQAVVVQNLWSRVGVYSAIRHQFNTAVGKFEGVEEVLAHCCWNLYF